MTVLLVKNKDNKSEQANYEATAMMFLALVSLFVVGIALYYYFFGIPLVDKYDLGNLFYAVLVIAILQYFNDYLLKVYRAKGKMFGFTFYQSIIPIFLFTSVFLSQGKQLILYLTLSYVFGHLLSLFFFIIGKGININGKPTFSKGKVIVTKGFLLFVYNFCFYMIIVSTKTLIGTYYPVKEFGYFTFSYTLANAALLLLTAFSSLVTPKLIDKFNTNNTDSINRTVSLLRINYIYLSHGLMYAAMMFFPILLFFMPQYSETLRVLNLTALATVLYTNSFGYTSFLMSKNREKSLARNALISLIVNILLVLMLILIIKVNYEYVVLGTLISYIVFAYLTVYSGKKELQQPIGFFDIMKECFPRGVLIPLVVAVCITSLNNGYLMFIPLLIFVLMNIKEIKEIIISFKRILNKPEIVDVK